jgi:hypothetical protein
MPAKQSWQSMEKANAARNSTGVLQSRPGTARGENEGLMPASPPCPRCGQKDVKVIAQSDRYGDPRQPAVHLDDDHLPVHLRLRIQADHPTSRWRQSN